MYFSNTIRRKACIRILMVFVQPYMYHIHIWCVCVGDRFCAAQFVADYKAHTQNAYTRRLSNICALKTSVRTCVRRASGAFFVLCVYIRLCVFANIASYRTHASGVRFFFGAADHKTESSRLAFYWRSELELVLFVREYKFAARSVWCFGVDEICLGVRLIALRNTRIFAQCLSVGDAMMMMMSKANALPKVRVLKYRCSVDGAYCVRRLRVCRSYVDYMVCGFEQ